LNAFDAWENGLLYGAHLYKTYTITTSTTTSTAFDFPCQVKYDSGDAIAEGLKKAFHLRDLSLLAGMSMFLFCMWMIWVRSLQTSCCRFFRCQGMREMKGPLVVKRRMDIAIA
jgi:hypothetical protein